MTRAELRTKIQRAINDPNGVFLPTEAANALIDEAMDFLAEHRSPVGKRLVLPLKPYWTYYRLTAFAPDALLPVRMFNATTGKRMDCLSLDELDTYRPKWEESTGDPAVWSPRGWGHFAVYPCPATAAGLLYIDYLAWPPALLHDSAEPPFAAEDQEALFLYGWAESLARGAQADQLPAAWKRLMAVVAPDAAKRGLRLPNLKAQQGRANGNGAGTTE